MIISNISYSRLTGVETWITSDGRAYFVSLNENSEATPEVVDDEEQEDIRVTGHLHGCID